jgi:hypothetical protein
VATRRICTCGSGLPFDRCHGDSRNDFARDQALHEAGGIAFLFPSVRVRGVDSFLERSAAAAPDEAALEAAVAEGLGLVDEREWRRTVDGWAEPYADRWASLTGAAGDTAAAERALVSGALRAGIEERAPTPLDVVAPLEGHRVEPPTYAALAVAIRPMFVWSVDEARAGEACARERRKPRQRLEAVQEVGGALLTFDHVRRTRALAARLAGDLPFRGLPRASRVLARACDEVAGELAAARRASLALLIAYVEQRTAATVIGHG